MEHAAYESNNNSLQENGGSICKDISFMPYGI